MSDNFYPLDTPESVANLLRSMQLSKKESLSLNRELANLARRHFRQQIRSQRNAHDGTAYAPRSKRSPRSGNMFTGLSRSLKTQITPESFAVGLTGEPGIVAKKHQEGENIGYGYRVKGWFNTQTNKWEGGTKKRGAYKLPQRVTIAWSPELTREVMTTILQKMEPQK